MAHKKVLTNNPNGHCRFTVYQSELNGVKPVSVKKLILNRAVRACYY